MNTSTTTELPRQTRSPFKSAAYQYIRSTDRLPSTDCAASAEAPIAAVKLFTGAWTWYVAGFDPETGLAFGLTVQEGVAAEIGDFSMIELVAIRARFGLPIERDLYFRPTDLLAIAQAAR